MTRPGRSLSRRWIVVTVVAGSLALGQAASGGAAGGGRERLPAVVAQSPAMGNCEKPRIQGLTENRTGIAMHVLQWGHGITNEWCHAPVDFLGAHSRNGWLISGDSSGIEMHIEYRLENGDEILFAARLRESGGSEAGCSFIRVVQTRRHYECEAEEAGGIPGFRRVRFVVLATPAQR
jgi:hypothetical protein